MEIFKLFGSVLVDTAEAEKSISKTDEKAEGLGKKLQSGIKTAGKWAAGLTAGAVAVGAAMLKSAKDSAENLDVIDKASQRMGIGAESYQELAHAAGLCGVEMSTMEKAAKKLEGTDLNFDDAIAQIYELETAEERSALAAELFGESVAYQMTPMLNASAEEMAAMRQEANDLGIVMSEDSVKAGAAMNDTFTKLTESFDGVKNEIGAALMPVISELLTWVLEHMPQIKAFVGEAVDFIRKGIKELEPIIKAMGPVVEKVFGVIGYAWENYLKPIFMGIIEFLDGVFSGNWEKIFSGLGTIVENIFKAIIGFVKIPINAIIELLNKAIDGFNKIQIPDWVPLVGGKGLDIPHIPALAKGGDIQDAGTVLVGEKGPEFLNLPQGARVTPLKNLTPVSQDNSEVVSLLKQILDKLDESKAININKREFARIVSEVN